MFVYGMEGANNGCNFYRIRQPLTKIMEKDLFPCATSSLVTNLDDQANWMERSDIIVTQAGTSDKFLDYLMENKGKKKFVLDYDDNIFDVSPYNPSYRQHGMVEVVHKNEDGSEVNLWKDGVDGFHIKENMKRIFAFTEVLKAVDLVTTPSSVLAGVFRKYGAKNVRVIKNFLDFKTWKPLNLVKDDFFRIGYQGGWSHYPDWSEIQGVLQDIMSEFKNVKLVIMGQHYEGALKGISEDRIEVVPWTTIDIYPHIFRTLNIDIGIAPLADNTFNSCKSEIKWEEYSSLGIPCVASNRPPYSLAIDHEKTGFLCSNKDEWYQAIANLVKDADLRRSIGSEAMRTVKANYDMDEKVSEYESAYKSVVGKELILVKH